MPISFDWLSAFIMALFSNGVALERKQLSFVKVLRLGKENEWLT